MRRLSRVSPAMVVACIALGVALSGTAIATTVALPRNSVGTPQLKNNAVATAKIRNNAVTSAKVRNGTLQAADFVAGELPAGAEGPAGPAGPSDAYARFLNGPIAVPGAATTLANLTIPQAGKYVVWGKAYFTSTVVGTVTCRLEAGTDVDQSVTYVSPAAVFTLATNVVHDFAAAGSVDFKCSATGTQQANYIKVTAVRVANLTNSG